LTRLSQVIQGDQAREFGKQQTRRCSGQEAGSVAVADPAANPRQAAAIAVVGVACRYPDADDAPELLDVVLSGRRAFRRIPPVRVDLAEYYQPDRTISDATYSTRAALITDWRFDRRAFGIDRAGYAAADPAVWLALETTARALAGAGLTAGIGIDRDRTGVIIGNTLGGDVSRAHALRARWPFVRRVLSDALTGEVPQSQADAVLKQAERRYLATFPTIGAETLVGGSPGGIATAISGYFGFRGASHAIDNACTSSLQAIASACSSLTAGDLDAVITGGVDVSLDPLELIGLAKAGVLATSDVRIYDETPTGFLPAEGCGIVVLMRTADARAIGLPVYAEIVGWGASAAGGPGDAETGASSQLLAMRRAYDRAQVDPCDVQLFEGNGASTKEDDEAELVALEALRTDARWTAALGSVKANIGNARAAAGAASLIKSVLSLTTGVIPPATGVGHPHALIHGGMARLSLPEAAQEWPAGTRFAGVSALDSVGANVHLVLRAEPAAPARHERWSRSRAVPGRTLDDEDGISPLLMSAPTDPLPFLLQAHDRFALATVLSRIATIARWLSDAELQDLACLLGREPDQQGTCRVALVARGQDQLAERAEEAAALLPRLADGLLTVRPGVFAADKADGRVTLLLSGESTESSASLTDSVTECLSTLRWLESLDVHATGAVGHGLGALAGLAWAGVLGEGDVAEIAKLRSQFLDRSAIEHAPPATTDASQAAPDTAPAGADPAGHLHVGNPALRPAIAEKFRLGPPRRRLVSTLTGAEVRSVDDAIDLICSGFSGVAKVTEAISSGAVGATLMFETGPGKALGAVAAETTRVPTVSLEAGLAEPEGRMAAAAALFAAGAVGQPRALFAGWPSRPIDIWRERVFITSPCERKPQLPATREGPEVAPGQTRSGQHAASTDSAVPAAPDQPADQADSVKAADPTAEPQPASEADPVKAADPQPADQVDSIPAAEPADAVAADPTPESADLTTESADLTSEAQPTDQVTEAAAVVPAPGAVEQAEPVEPTQTDSVTPADAADPADPVATADPVVTAETDSATLVADAEATTDAADLTDSATPSATPRHAAPANGENGHAGLAEVRDAFERRLPDRPLIAAATASAAQGEETGQQAPRQPLTAATAADKMASVHFWADCFAETLIPADYQVKPYDDEPWRTHIAGPGSVSIATARAFRSGTNATRTLAVLADPSDADSRATALRAARDAVRTGQLVVLTTSPGFTGFFAGLQEEHPQLGVTLLRIKNPTRGLGLARPFAYAEPGTFRELVFRPDGSICEPALARMPLTGGGAFPLGPDDVVLVSRGTRGAGLALAQVLACCGTPVAVIGRASDGDDSELVSGLEQLRSAGARIGYEVIDITKQASLSAAVERIEARLGPVTAIGHAVSQGAPVPLKDLTDIEIATHVAGETATLNRLVESVRPGQLRMIVTFGSVAGRYGLAGASVLALSSAALAGQAEQLAAAAGNCRSLHIDIPAWSTSGLGDVPELANDFASAGTAPIEVSAASRLLLKILTTDDLPERLAIHGRVGGPAARTAAQLGPAELAAAGLTNGGRFLQDVKVYYPRTELICTARLSLATDPYLADYRVDGLPVLPPALVLEALAEAASVLAGRPLTNATSVRLESPIVIPATGDAELLIGARRNGTTITTVLRCGDSSFAVEHAAAEFSCDGPAEMPAPQAAKPLHGLAQLPGSSSGLVDGAELYGPIAFQSGRFRRVALLHDVTARSCRALARGSDDQPWFVPDGPLADMAFLLGSPGLNDAALHAVQACVPHRRVRPAGCESVVFSGKAAEGAVEIRATSRPADVIGPPSGSRESGPELTKPSSSGDEQNPAAETTEAVSTKAARSTKTAEPNPVPAPSVESASASSADPGPADEPGADSRPRSKRGRRGPRRNTASKAVQATREPVKELDLASAANPADQPVAGAAQPAAPEPAAAADQEQAAERGPRNDAIVSELASERWDIEAVDSTGDLLVAWRGVVLRDAGPLPRNSAWPPSLLSIYLERASRELGLDPGLRVTVGCGQPDGPGPEFLAKAIPRQAPPVDAAEPPSVDLQPDTSSASVVIAAGTGPLTGFTLQVSASVTVACGWNAVEPGHRHDQPPAGLAPMYARLRGELAEPPATLAARLRAICSCLAMAGLEPSEPVSCQRTTSDGWALLQTAAVSVASTIVNVSGVASPVAIAILTGPPVAGAPSVANAQASAKSRWRDTEKPTPARSGPRTNEEPTPAAT
jgi:enediyne polyketide synthase